MASDDSTTATTGSPAGPPATAGAADTAGGAAGDQSPAAPSAGRIAVASLVGTAIEFYDFYVFATAAALVIGPVFFPSHDSTAQTLSAFASFGIAFLARPIGAAVFGHFGDRVGRKVTLVASLLVMGISTLLIGLLPSYASIGVAAPVLLCLLRMGQGLGLGGEWGGAALVATENAPPGRRAWYGMFPQLGAPIGFVAANGLFLLLAVLLSDEQFRAWGWRVPFLLSAVLVAVGLYVRVSLAETPVFARAAEREERSRVPVAEVFARHSGRLLLGSLSMVVCYAIFYLTTVFTLNYGTAELGWSTEGFLGLLCVAVLFMAVGSPVAARLSDRHGRRPVLVGGSVAIALLGFLFEPLVDSGSTALLLTFLCVGLFLMGVTFAPMGAFLPELFPTRVRYTGSSAAYNLGGILGGSLAPYIAAVLVERGGLSWVGWYLTAAAVLSALAVLLLRETRADDLAS
ncbi:MFS transporter [Allostreptomyces psammosilenae]|uniref:Putative proline/betaine transporter n=1 Tax=Allostreptomyces psammosilenae TaxID=1892865 RepID=A0A852ZLA6_9ACTN|nr:MFS transporter [Allostreptomyces psammosilenae]NYI03189.1 metabolite-proton symporter [Allostreptomyces psammosilenae]